MDYRAYRTLLIAATTALLVGCSGLTKSPAEGLTFTAPPGFTSKASVMGVTQIWTTSDNRQVMLVLRLPVVVTSTDALKSANVKDAKILANKAIALCGHRPAMYMELSGVNSTDNSNEFVDAVFLRGTTHTLISMYIYSQDVKPDPAAQAALRELCAKPGAATS